MARPPWQDALRRAAFGGRAAAPEAAAPSAAPAAEPIDPSTISPMLAQLVAEREQLKARIAAIAGGDANDPRYVVEPLAARRAELARWAEARDAARAAALQARQPGTLRTAAANAEADRPTPGYALRAMLVQPRRQTAADTLRPTGAETVRPTPGEALRTTPGQSLRTTRGEVLRATPGELLRGTPGQAEPAGRVRATLAAWDAARDATSAFRKLGERLGPSAGEDPLDRRLARARDIGRRVSLAQASAERALAAAREALPRDWTRRVEERIPGLGRADPYVRSAAEKLAVAVGTLQEVSEKTDELRATALAVRELHEADGARDEARRDRALERLKARRSKGPA